MRILFFGLRVVWCGVDIRRGMEAGWVCALMFGDPRGYLRDTGLVSGLS